MGLKVKLQMIKTIILPMILYASAAWGHCAHTYRNSIQTFMNACVRAALNAPRYMPNRYINRDLNQDPHYVDTHLRKHAESVFERIRAQDSPAFRDLHEALNMDEPRFRERDKHKRPVDQNNRPPPRVAVRRLSFRYTLDNKMTTAPKKTNTLIDEPLILSIFPISFLLKLDHKRFEILYWIMGIWAQSYCLYCLYDLTKHFDMFSSYITSIGIIQVGVINIPFIVDNRVFPGIRNIQLSLWPLDFGGEKLRKHLLLCNRKMKYDCLTIIIITFTMIFMLLLHGMVSSDVIINIKSSDEICGNWKTLCKITYIVYMEFTTYTSAVFVSITFYYMRIIRNQIILLNGVLENITKNIEFPPESEAYQTEIFIRLKFCISRHIELRRLFDALGVVKTWPVVVYFFCWTFVFTIELIMIFTASDIKSTLLGLLELIPTTISTIIFLKNSQGLINESLELNNVAAQCPYYDWNKKNRQALQMLLMNSTEPIKICTYSLLDLDYSLFISMLKIAYNLAVMVKYIDMRNKTNN